jgi:DNA-binding protein YbaB
LLLGLDSPNPSTDLSLQLKKEAEGLQEQASEAAEKLAKLEVWGSALSTWP